MAYGLAILLAIGVGLGAYGAFAGRDDRGAIEASLVELEKDPTTKELTADAVKHSRTALERATRMRGAGDDKHARLAEGLAMEWAHVGQSLAKAASAEGKARDARESALDAGARVDRERAMLEQQLAENGRLQAELAKEEVRDGGAPKATSRDGGAHP